MNPFTILSEIQSAYLTYVHTFQKLKTPAIKVSEEDGGVNSL